MLMTSLFNAGLTVFIIRGNYRKPTNILLGIYLATLSLWALALIGTQYGPSYMVWLYCTKGTYTAGLIIAASFYLFAIAFPEEILPRKRTIILVYAISLLYIAALFISPTFLTERIVVHDWGNSAELNTPEYLIFVAIFCFLYLGGLIRIWYKWFRASGIVRTRLLVIAAGVTATGIGGLYYDIILASPFIDQFQYIWTGPLFNTVMAVLIMYSVLRLRLFNAKVIVTELLISLLWVFTLLRALVASEPREQFLNGALFLFSLVIGSLLVHSVRREVEQRERIEQLSNEKSEFMSFASHEIRNPITAMRGYASLIADGTTGETNQATKDAAQTILVTGNQVLMLIAQFLDKSKLELGQIAYAKDKFDLGKSVSVVVDGFVPHASQKNLYLKKEFDQPDLQVIADETKLKEVIGNLIDNSIKYTPTGGITVSVAKHNGMGRVTISDTGVGIPKETIPHLFQKFSRADAQKMNLKGTGLGLFLGKQFIEGMGGKIWVESGGEGQGSRFIVEVPAA